MTPLIESRALTIHRPGTTEPVLAQVDFRIRPAEIVTVVGPNGSGKTTTIGKLGHLLQEQELSVRCLKRHLLRQLQELPHLRLLNVGQLFVNTNLTMVGS